MRKVEQIGSLTLAALILLAMIGCNHQSHEHTHNTPAICTVTPTMWDQGYTVYKCSICSNEYPTHSPR